MVCQHEQCFDRRSERYPPPEIHNLYCASTLAHRTTAEAGSWRNAVGMSHKFGGLCHSARAGTVEFEWRKKTGQHAEGPVPMAQELHCYVGSPGWHPMMSGNARHPTRTHTHQYTHV